MINLQSLSPSEKWPVRVPLVYKGKSYPNGDFALLITEKGPIGDLTWLRPDGSSIPEVLIPLNPALLMEKNGGRREFYYDGVLTVPNGLDDQTLQLILKE